MSSAGASKFCSVSLKIWLARVVASRGELDQALAILEEGANDSYAASYALARGDILLSAGRRDEARQAYASAQTLASLTGRQLPTLQAKLQSLNPVPPRSSRGESTAQDLSGAENADIDDLFGSGTTDQGDTEGVNP